LGRLRDRAERRDLAPQLTRSSAAILLGDKARLPIVSPGDSEVKGIWFASACGWIRRQHGNDVLARVDARMPMGFRGLLLDPLPSEWYPERALALMLAAARAELTDGSAPQFITLLEDITLDGVGRFFRLVLSLSSPRFVLGKVPVMWSRLRRGAGVVSIEMKPDAVLVRYGEFPHFDDENYRLMTVASLQGICRATGSKAPRAEIERWTSDALDVLVRP
jgi:hypothetical protein